MKDIIQTLPAGSQAVCCIHCNNFNAGFNERVYFDHGGCDIDVAVLINLLDNTDHGQADHFADLCDIRYRVGPDSDGPAHLGCNCHAGHDKRAVKRLIF